MTGRRRAVVLLSGQGSNLQALLDDFGTGPCSPEVVLVLADRPSAGGLQIASARGVPSRAVLPADFGTRAAFDIQLRDVVSAAAPDVVCLAGFMRILGSEFVTAFAERIVNTHPSLLPAFKGAHAVRDALNYGVKVTGCTVHLVDEEVDHGPILAQAAVPVLEGDDEATLHERIKVEEHLLLPPAVRAVAEGRVMVRGRATTILPSNEEHHR